MFPSHPVLIGFCFSISSYGSAPGVRRGENWTGARSLLLKSMGAADVPSADDAALPSIRSASFSPAGWDSV